MAKRGGSGAAPAIVAIGAAAGLLGAVTVALWPRKKTDVLAHGFTDLDIEALARMFASENPRGTDQLKIEQAWTQLRSKPPRRSLYTQMTNGLGWGPQGPRPVSTEEPARPNDRELAEKVLNGLVEPAFEGARQFFEPEQQDKAFRVAEVARAKKKRGEPLSPQEKRLLGYKSDADSIRRRWAEKGYRRVDEIDGVEFWT